MTPSAALGAFGIQPFEIVGASVRLREPRLAGRRASALDAGALPVGAGERDIAERGLRVRFDLGLAVRTAAPARDDKARASLHHALELVVRRDPGRVLVAERARALEQRGLDLAELGDDQSGEPV